MLRRTTPSLWLSTETMNKPLLCTEYAVRGRLHKTANEIQAKIGDYPFKKLIRCNIGNPQALNQAPLSYARNVMAATTAPHMMDQFAKFMKPDVIERAKFNVKNTQSGAYSDSQGYEFVRKNVADFIDARDGTSQGTCRPQDLCLTNGASQGVVYTLQALISGPEDGVLIPIPQYPLYTATMSLLNGSALGYGLHEKSGWSVTRAILEEALSGDKVKAPNGKPITPRCLVVINPGNPTGQVLDRETMVDLIKFCHEHKLLLLADEVYQTNIYTGSKRFHSFREVLLSMGAPYSNEVQLFSCHSTSKGIYGECGRRGGYLHMMNLDAHCSAVREQFIKLPSINLCPNIEGQLAMDLLVNGPQKGEASYEEHEAESKALFDSLQRRATMLEKALNDIPGINSQPIEGAMYAFPTMKLPAKFIEAAKNLAEPLPPDEFWCMELLRQEGIVVVPGSGFGQEDGTFHFRTTILPPEEEMGTVVEAMARFQKNIIDKYGPVE